MAKYKEAILGIVLVVVTSLSGLFSSCSQTLTRTISIVVPKEDNSTPDTGTTTGTNTTTTEPHALSNPTPTESPTPTTPPTTVEPSTPAAIPTTTSINYNVDISKYSFDISGAIDTPLSLSYEQIQSYTPVTEKVEIVCPDAEDETDDWTGVPISTLLKAAVLNPEASEVIFTAIDGYHIELPLEYVLRNGVFLAYQMNGETLSQDRGYPLRLVVKGAIGAYWLRWVTKIEVKPALFSFSNSSAIIRNLASNIPTAGSRLCSCILVRLTAAFKPANQKPL